MFEKFRPYLEEKVKRFQEHERSKYNFDLTIECDKEENKIVLNKTGSIALKEIADNCLAIFSYKHDKYRVDTMVDEADGDLYKTLIETDYPRIDKPMGMIEFILEFEYEGALIAFVDKHFFSGYLGAMY